MRHQLSGRKLGRTTSHRWAMFKNMATSLVEKGRVVTTLSKAKELRSFADHLITLGKKNDLHSKRRAFDFIRSRDAVQKLFGEVAPRFAGRNGGFTRIFKLGYRHGDSAPMAVIEYLSEAMLPLTPKEGKGEKKAAKKPEKKPDKKAAKKIK